MSELIPLLEEVRVCTLCAKYLPYAPKPIIQVGSNARLLIISQAPGIKAHQSGIPWDDASGKRLRQWLQISDENFYNADKVAILPMGFCYPGKGRSGDLPPRKECAPQWHQQLLDQLPNIGLTLFVGQYAQQYYLNDNYRTLTERIENWQTFPSNRFALPHPSPRNQSWFKKNPWFEQQALPALQQKLNLLWQS